MQRAVAEQSRADTMEEVHRQRHRSGTVKDNALIASTTCLVAMEKSFAATIAQIEEILKIQLQNDTVVQKLELKAEETQRTRAKVKESLVREQTQHQ